MTIIAIHQSNYMPWIPYFSKISESDVFIFFDDSQYQKNVFMNRNKIKTPNGMMYMTIPLESKKSYLKNIDEVILPANDHWKKKHIKAINANYAKAPFFEEVSEFLTKIIEQPHENLSSLNQSLIIGILKYLGIETKIVNSTDFIIDSNLNPTERLIHLIKAAKGNIYLSGPYGKKYLKESVFSKENINLVYIDQNLSNYEQLWGDFVPGLSIIDALFNMGEQTISLL